MRIEDLRNGNYVDVYVEGKKARYIVVNVDINSQIATLRDWTNRSKFYEVSKDEWNSVKDVLMTESELRKLEFVYDDKKMVYMLPNNGAWVYKNIVLVTKYNGCYDLIIREDKAFYGCKAIRVPFVHLLQNAVIDNYGFELSYV